MRPTSATTRATSPACGPSTARFNLWQRDLYGFYLAYYTCDSRRHPPRRCKRDHELTRQRNDGRDSRDGGSSPSPSTGKPLSDSLRRTRSAPRRARRVWDTASAYIHFFPFINAFILINLVLEKIIPQFMLLLV